MGLNLHQINYDAKLELRRLLKEKKRRRGKTDLHYFCKKILGYIDLTDENGFHKEFCEHLENKETKFKLSLLPRGTLKSSIGTIGHSLQCIVNNPNIRILIASEKFTGSTKYLEEIKGHIEHNPTFIDLYGNLKGKKTWSGSEIIVGTRQIWKKEPTIMCAGIDVTMVGMHYDRIKIDDPHSEKNTTNQDQIDKVIRWYRLLLSLLDPGGYIDINGTIWHFNDLYSYILNKERERVEKGHKRRFKILRLDSFEGTSEDLLNDIIPRNKLLWPQRLSAEFLREQLIEQGPYIFSCQYRLLPVDDESALFKRSWLITCKESDIPKNLNVYATVDPMQNEDGSDFLAITVVGMDNDWRYYLLDVRRLKADEHDTVDEMYDVWRMWKCKKIGIEAVAWQHSYFRYVKLLQMMKGHKLPIKKVEKSTRVTKRMQIKGMIPYFKAGLIIIPTPDGRLESLKGAKATFIDELTRYPRTANDDTVDALSLMNKLTQRPGVIQILKKLSPNSFMATRAKLNKHKGRLGRHNLRRESSYA